jgi:hypothetical protein
MATYLILKTESEQKYQNHPVDVVSVLLQSLLSVIVCVGELDHRWWSVEAHEAWALPEFDACRLSLT